MPVLAVANQKGGVGKTTTVVSLGAALREKGYRVLLVDNDPQANLAVALGVSEPDSLSPALGDLLMEHAHNRARYTVHDAIITTASGLDLLPANTRLSASELVLAGAIGRELVLRDILSPVLDSYDFVLIDCLPSLGLLTINALTAADAILIPVQADFLALQGVAQMLETVGAVRAKLNPSLFVVGALLTMMDVRTAHARSVASMLREALAGQVNVFETEIRTQVALKDSVQEGQTILDFRGDSQAAQAYRELADALVAAFTADSMSEQLEEAEMEGGEWAMEMAAEPLRAEPTLISALARPGEPEPEPAALSRFGDFLSGREDWAGQRAAQ